MVFPDDRTIDTRQTDSLETKAKNSGGSVVDADDCGVDVITNPVTRRFASIDLAMRPRTRLVLLLSAALLSVAAFAVQQYSLDRYGLSLDVPEWLWINLAVGWAFLLAGLAAKRARPDSGMGTLMVVFATIAMIRLLFTAPLIQWEQILGSIAIYGMTFLMLLAFPDGRIRGWQRWAAGAWIVFVAALATLNVLLTDFYAGVDDGVCCPEHLLLINHDPALYQQILTVGVYVGLSVIALLLWALFSRWRKASRVARRYLTFGTFALPVMTVLVLIPIIDLVWGFWFLRPRVSLYIEDGALLILPAVILASLVRSRLSQARVADMMRTFEPEASPGNVETHLREALDSPEARLVFRREESGDYMGVDGKQLDDSVLEGQSVTALDQRVSIVHDPALDHDLVVSAGTAASLAIDNARLQAELKAQLLEVQRSRRRLITATDDARRRVERDLHDGAQQRLVALSASLRDARYRRPEDTQAIDELLDEAAQEADVAIGELRELARGVHPAILTQAGVGPAVSSLIDRAPIPVSLKVDSERYPPEVEATAYFVITEALSNSFKHSAADHVRIEVRREGSELRALIEDNGVGGAKPDGSGLHGLADRVGALGGRLVVTSGETSGTTVTAFIPIAGEEP
jgi:signal transduction histidine kinase